MACGQLVLCDVLCFVKEKFANMPVKVLKSMLTDFYPAETLSEAKICLLSGIANMSFEKNPPNVPRRRSSDGRLAQETEDIVTLFTFLDEMKAIDRLPTYVASSPANMPSSRLYEGDLNILLTLLRNMDGRLNGFESALAAIANQVKAIQVWPSLPEPSRSISSESTGQQSRDTLHHTQPPVPSTRVITTTTVTGDQPAVQPACRPAVGGPGYTETETEPYRWSTAVAAASTPISYANRFTVLGSTTDDDDAQNPYQTVQPRRRRRHRESRDSQEPLPQDASRTHAQRQQQQQRQLQRPRGQLLFGKAKTGSVISAARIQRKKTVICVDNVNSTASVETIKDFISSLSVEVITCFQVKPRRRPGETEDDVRDKKAFRVCIFTDELDRLLNADAWPESVSICTWFSKPRSRDETNKRLRLGNSPDNTHGNAQSSLPKISSDCDNNVEQQSSALQSTAINTADAMTGCDTSLKIIGGDDTIVESYDDHVDIVDINEEITMDSTHYGE